MTLGKAEAVVLGIEDGKAEGMGCKPLLGGTQRSATGLDMLAISTLDPQTPPCRAATASPRSSGAGGS